MFLLEYLMQVRSLRLDVKVWEPVIMDLFHALGNDYANSIWEALLPKEDQGYVKAYNQICILLHYFSP
jgi:Arf-GAP/coiled-coil/ANK repeat/PH domain-containing protein